MPRAEVTDEQGDALRRFALQWGRYWKSHLADDYAIRIKLIGADKLYTLLDAVGPRWLYGKQCAAVLAAAKERARIRSQERINARAQREGGAS